jgi:hypothetical protein
VRPERGPHIGTDALPFDYTPRPRCIRVRGLGASRQERRHARPRSVRHGAQQREWWPAGRVQGRSAVRSARCRRNAPWLAVRHRRRCRRTVVLFAAACGPRVPATHAAGRTFEARQGRASPAGPISARQPRLFPQLSGVSS